MQSTNVDFVYRNPRPVLAIVGAGGANLGNCYNASYYDVTSLRPLDAKTIQALHDAGFLGYGQEFMFHQVGPNGERTRVPAELDWRTSKDVVPTGVEKVPCTMCERGTGKVIEGVAINPYSGKPYEPSEQAFYTYRCESRVDSSD